MPLTKSATLTTNSQCETRTARMLLPGAIASQPETAAYLVPLAETSIGSAR